MKQTTLMRSVGLWGIVLTVGAAGLAQEVHITVRPLASNVIVPQSRVFHLEPPWVPPSPRPMPPRWGRAVVMTAVTASVEIRGQLATTTLDVGLRNPLSQRQEAELIVPVPAGAVVRGFTFEGSSSEPTAELLPREEARRIYDEIVAQVRDPALLEFVGLNLIRSSVFPVEPNGTQKVRLVYEELLTVNGNRVDYVLPRSEALSYDVPWKLSVHIDSKQPISTLYSPSHDIAVERHGAGKLDAKLAAAGKVQPGPFRLSYLIEQDGVTASLLAYPEPSIGGGYFLLLAGLPADVAEEHAGQIMKREVTLVLDRSGSMNGEKLEQVQEAVLQVLAGLDDGEAFNIIIYNEGVDLFAESPVVKSDETMRDARGFVRSIKARGGTNIHDALVEVLRQKPTKDMLPIVLFLTDGLPTIGETSEVKIRDLATKANPHERRIFTFGVGVDVNTPLLEKVAEETRATATFVLPKEDVEVKVSQVFNQLAGPVLAGPELTVNNQSGQADPRRVRDILPAKLPDLFEGDQLVVLGQYLGDDPLHFGLAGNYLGSAKSFSFQFNLDDATTRNSFVPRLWASRKIAYLIDAIRQMGANGNPLHPNPPDLSDPKIKELVDEIVRLSTEFGILTEYTAFLAREGSEIVSPEVAREVSYGYLGPRAIQLRRGAGSVSQSKNSINMKQQRVLNYANVYFEADMQQVSVSNVQQVNDMAFYRRGKKWIDGRLVTKLASARPDRTVSFGTTEYRDLVSKLMQQGRQGTLSLSGEILMNVDGETVLVKGPSQAE